MNDKLRSKISRWIRKQEIKDDITVFWNKSFQEIKRDYENKFLISVYIADLFGLKKSRGYVITVYKDARKAIFLDPEYN